jgi:hypothetical protein
MTETGLKLGGNAPVEVDETFVGGKVKNMHRNKRPKETVFGNANKTIVMGMERGGTVRGGVVYDRKLHNMRPMLEANVHEGSHVITDERSNYPMIAKENDYRHEIIDHTNAYVRDHIHTNGIENFGALLKRGLHGTYVSVDAALLNAYVAEQVFRFNHREDCNDAGRFIQIISQIVGKRLTYAELTTRQSTN